MKVRITIDIEHIAKQIAEQCFYQADSLEQLENYLVGAAYAVGFSISRTRSWKEGDFIEIGKKMFTIGSAHFLSLKKY